MAQDKKTASTLFNMIFILVTIACLSALLIGVTYRITEEPIRLAKDQKELEAIAEVAGEFNNNPFEEQMNVLDKNKNPITIYPARQDGTVTAIAVKSYSNKGFGGKIELIVGFAMDGSINGYKVIEQKETPGLGTKITDPKFKDQFIELNPRRSIIKVKQDGGEIDAVTAATISSRAVTDAIDRAYKAYNKFSTGN